MATLQHIVNTGDGPVGSFLSPEADINTSDLELLHHFSTVTYLTMSNVPEEQKLWQTTIVQLGLQHTFLLRGILALSALHLNYLKSSPQAIGYIIKASTHQNIALAQFRQAVTSVNASTFDAVLAFSCVLPIHSMAITACSTFRAQMAEQDNLSAFLESTQLLRSVNQLLLPALDVFKTNTILPLIQVTRQDLPEADIYPGIESFDRLEAACSTFSNSPSAIINHARVLTFRSTIAQLRTTFARTGNAAGVERFTVGIVLMWIIAVSDEYMVLLNERHPSAMAILAHFAALLYRNQDVWWLEGLGSSLVEIISVDLGDEWADVMSWPMMATGLI